MRLAYRVLLFSSVIIIVLVVAILAIVDNRLYGSITAESAESLAREARFVASQWRGGFEADSLADAAGRSLQRRVTLIDSSGVVVGDSEFDGSELRRLSNHLFRPEIVDASKVGTGVSRRVSASKGDEEIYVAVPAGAGFARVSVSTATVENIFDRARRDILTTGLIALAAAMIAAALFARNVSRPIVELRDVARAMTDRDFDPARISDAPGEVGDLARALSQLSTRLTSLETTRRDFVANVSHELRTPLTVVSGFAETLTDSDVPLAERKEFAEMILANTRRMQQIVDDLLDLSRIESGGWIPKPEQVDLSEVVGEILASLEPAASKKALAVRTYFPAPATSAWADRTAIRQILSNLVENAIRHTSRGVITVFSEAAPDGVWVGVRDTGEGIPEEHLTRIFERFYRADASRARDHGGTGLGLAIVRHMAEAHGGRVRATSREAEGTAIAAFFPSPPSGAASSSS